MNLFNDDPLHFVSEAQVLYVHHARAAFLISMKDYWQRGDAEAEQEHSRQADYFAKLLRDSGQEVPNIHDEQWLAVWGYKASCVYDLYLAREELKGQSCPYQP